MKTVDLHCHTYYSDGTYSPKELMQLAAQMGISAIAVTDHDTIGAWEEAETYADVYGVGFIPGVELSTKIYDYEVDILGLNMIENKEGLSVFIEKEKLFRQERNRKMIAALNKEGIDISYEEVSQKAQKMIAARPHFAKVLVEKGYCPTMHYAFKKYLSPGRKTYVEKESHSPESVIEEIRKTGGIAVLAHPVVYMKNYHIPYEKIEKILRGLIDMGLGGIEAIYPLNSKKDEAHWLRLAQNYAIRISGGSDFHGDNKPLITLGMANVPYSVMESLLQI